MGEGEGAGEESSAVIERSKDWNGVAERAVRKSHPRHEDVELPVKSTGLLLRTTTRFPPYGQTAKLRTVSKVLRPITSASTLAMNSS